MQNYSSSARSVLDDSDAVAIDLRAVIRALWRGKGIIALTTVLAIALAIVYLVMRPPVFEATASVLIDQRAATPLEIRNSLTDAPINESLVDSQIHVILSNRVSGAVVEALRLDEDPVFVPHLRPDQGGFSPGQVRLALGRLIEPVFGKVPYLSPPPPEPLTETELRELHRRTAIATLARRLSANQVGSSYVINVTAKAGTPTRAALIANTVVASYIAQQRANKQAASMQASRWLDQQIATLEAQVKASTDALDAYRIANGLINDEQIEQSAAQVDRLRTSLAEARRTREGLAAEGSAAGSDETAQRSLAARQTSIASREATLEASVASAENELSRLVHQRAEFAQLQRQALADQRIYERFLDETNEIGALETYHEVNARIIADALVPLHPSNPSGKLVVAFAAVLGGCLGIAIIGIGELLHTSFRTREELSQFTELPVLASLPRLRVGASPRTVLTALRDAPFSAFAESVRSFRASALQRSGPTQSRVLLVTSSRAREGKSSSSLLLASTAADIGRKVLFIDCDLRRSRLSKILGLRPKATLEDVLTRQKPPETAIMPLKDGFDIICAGRMTRRKRIAPLDLLSSDNMDRLITDMREFYDLIILDTPPILPVKDAAVLSRFVDGVLLVVFWRRTTRALVADALRELRAFDARVDGLVLSMVDRKAEASHRAIPHHVYHA